MACWRGVYRAYRRRYSVAPTFRFNGAGIQLYGEGRIELGADSYVGELSTLQAAPGGLLRIGSRCTISHNVRIYTSTVSADADLRRGAPPSVTAAVVIGDGVWIGANAYVGPGVHIGDNAVVGANAVVTRDVPAGEIWGGVPARFIRSKRGTQ
ncbi:MAG: acyltransferase [Burkholderiales bacterium]|nr:acyltransferase [Burkholderiales bacterium]